MNAAKDILTTITTYRDARGWTGYALAEHSGLTQSTISSWYWKGAAPTVASLENEITLAQLFAEGNEPVPLTASRMQLLERWSKLSKDQQAAVFLLIDKM